MEAPYNIQNHRREQCQHCPTPCEFQSNEGYRSEGDNACPIGRWMAYVTFVRNRFRGVGDAVGMVADPIAGVIDRVLGTKIKGCASCAKRKEMLNQLIPFGQNHNNGM